FHLPDLSVGTDLVSPKPLTSTAAERVPSGAGERSLDLDLGDRGIEFKTEPRIWAPADSSCSRTRRMSSALLAPARSTTTTPSVLGARSITSDQLSTGGESTRMISYRSRATFKRRSKFSPSSNGS